MKYNENTDRFEMTREDDELIILRLSRLITILQDISMDDDNCVFKLHNYCWCEEVDCPYCGAGEPLFRYNPEPYAEFPEELPIEIWWYKEVGREMESSRVFDMDELESMAVACLGEVAHQLFPPF